jgi:hypothetical protein
MANQHFPCSGPMTVTDVTCSQHHTVCHIVNFQHQNETRSKRNSIQGMDLIHLAQDMVQWLVLTSLVMDIHVQ